MREDESKKDKTGEVAGNAFPSDEAMLSELKSAYESITRLQNTMEHRKISLEIERKLRREGKTGDGK